MLTFIIIASSSIPTCTIYAGYIDLSKRRVSPEEIQKCEEKYSKAKTVSVCTVPGIATWK